MYTSTLDKKNSQVFLYGNLSSTSSAARLFHAVRVFLRLLKVSTDQQTGLNWMVYISDLSVSTEL